MKNNKKKKKKKKKLRTPIKNNSNTIELTVHTFCFWVLDLLCVIVLLYLNLT